MAARREQLNRGETPAAGAAGAAPADNRLYHADNLQCLAQMAAEKLRPDLVYIDPPFGLQQDFRQGKGPVGARKRRGPPAAAAGALAYSDCWPGGLDGYLAMLRPRLAAIHAGLAAEGSFYIHLDSTVVHYVKIELDRIFGADCFQREIIWRIGWISGYKSKAQNWIRNHDTILFYTRQPRKFFFAKQLVPHPAGYARRPAKGSGAAPQTAGIPVDDVWNGSPGEAELTGAESLDSIQIKSFSREKTGYPTQKNLSLLKRIVAASCPPGGLVADFFCGSGTTLVAAAQLGRRFVGCDSGALAIQTAQARLRCEAPETNLATISVR